MPRLIRLSAVMAILIICQDVLAQLGAPWPKRILNKRDIERTKADAKDIDIRGLPLDQYPLLAKFKSVEIIGLLNKDNNAATDQHLEALSRLGFTNFGGITLINCRRITDRGIRFLTNFPSFKGGSFEGTSITDAACEVFAQMHVTGLNVANCRHITKKGLLRLPKLRISNISNFLRRI